MPAETLTIVLSEPVLWSMIAVSELFIVSFHSAMGVMLLMSGLVNADPRGYELGIRHVSEGQLAISQSKAALRNSRRIAELFG